MERYILKAVLVSLTFLLFSCNVPSAHISVFRGNQAFIKGDFQEANIHYLQGINREENKYTDWLRYNLGNTYFVLGEPSSAKEEWKKVSDGSSPGLKFSTLFNLGVYSYEEGLYEAAYGYFLEALEIEPSSFDAKRNLELSLEKIESKEASGKSQKSAGEETRTEGQKGYTERILDYVKRKEEQRWVSSDVSENEDTVKDW